MNIKHKIRYEYKDMNVKLTKYDEKFLQFKQILKRLRNFSKLQVKVTLVLFSTKDFKNSLFLTECMFLSYLKFFFKFIVLSIFIFCICCPG